VTVPSNALGNYIANTSQVVAYWASFLGETLTWSGLQSFSNIKTDLINSISSILTFYGFTLKNAITPIYDYVILGGLPTNLQIGDTKRYTAPNIQTAIPAVGSGFNAIHEFDLTPGVYILFFRFGLSGFGSLTGAWWRAGYSLTGTNIIQGEATQLQVTFYLITAISSDTLVIVTTNTKWYITTQGSASYTLNNFSAYSVRVA
jgi:hypothetical protein